MSRFVPLALSILVLSAMGCQQEKASDLDVTPALTIEQPTLAEETSFVSTSNETYESPALNETEGMPEGAIVPEVVPVDANPDHVVKRFMDALWSGETDVAERLLTEKARLEIRKTQWGLVSFESGSSEYSVGQPQYATNRQLRCQVDCAVTSPTDTGPVSYTLAWTMKRQSHNGWRVSGSIIFDPTTNAPYLINFEDASQFDQALTSLNPSDEPIHQADGGGTELR